MSARTTFVAVTGQRDNIGDSLLRRPLLRAAQESGGGCAVFVGGDAEDYVTNLGVADVDTVYTDRTAWLTAMVRAALAGRANVVLNAGELTLDGASTRDRLFLMPLIAFVRLRRGAFIHAGTGLRNPTSRLTWPVRWLVGLANVVAWRDARSFDAIRRGSVEPDWAFGEGPDLDIVRARHESTRQSAPTIALSLRGGGDDLSPESIARLRERLDVLGASPIVVVQVRRDGAVAELLGAALDAPVIAWPADDDHAIQERRVREVYAGCTWVSSDRLHVVATAATEGAVPLDLLPDTHGKVRRTLAPAKLRLQESSGAPERLAADRIELLDGLAHARSRLAALTARIAAACAKRPR